MPERPLVCGRKEPLMPEPGAIDVNACPTRQFWRRYARGECRCRPRCAVCGFGPHAAVHGPRDDEPPGSRPYDHAYAPPEDPDA